MKILTSREKRGKFFILFIIFATNVTVMQCEYKKKQKQQFMKYFRKKVTEKITYRPQRQWPIVQIHGVAKKKHSSGK